MKKNVLRRTTHIITNGPQTRRLILRNEIIRVLSRRELEVAIGGVNTHTDADTESERPGGCTDTTN